MVRNHQEQERSRLKGPWKASKLVELRLTGHSRHRRCLRRRVVVVVGLVAMGLAVHPAHRLVIAQP